MAENKISPEWEKLADDDFVAREGDYCLRVEQMDDRDWWWMVYYREDCIVFDVPHVLSRNKAIKLAEKAYFKHKTAQSKVKEQIEWKERDENDFVATMDDYLLWTELRPNGQEWRWAVSYKDAELVLGKHASTKNEAFKLAEAAYYKHKKEHKPDCEKHPDNIEGFASMDALAEEVSNLRYDKLQDFFDALAKRFSEDSYKDAAAGRSKLSNHLFECAFAVDNSARCIKRAWKICKPYMNKKL